MAKAGQLAVLRLFVAVGICAAAAPALADVVVVSPTASESTACATSPNDAPAAAPCASIPGALAATNAGDTVVLEPGVYTGANAHQLYVSGQTIRCADVAGDAAAIHPDAWVQSLGCVIDCENAQGPAIIALSAGGATTTVVGVNITGCYGYATASGYFGAAALVSGSDVGLALRTVAIESNVAHYGGGIFADGTAVVSCKGVLFGRGLGAAGGALFLSGSARAELSSSVIEGHLSSTAGAIHVGSSASLLLSNGTVVRRNVASTSGVAGAALVALNNARVDVFDSTVTNNDAQGHCGGLYAAHNATVRVVRSAFTGNSAAGEGSVGGAFYLDDAAMLILEDANVVENTADGHGAGFYLSGQAVLDAYRSNISGNVAQLYGGGVYGTAEVLVRLDACNLENNTAPAGFGGTVYMEGSIHLSFTHISGSVATTGGGVALFHRASMVLQHSSISRCVAYNGGGAVALGDSAALVVGNRSVLDYNSGSTAGGALWAIGNSIAVVRDSLVAYCYSMWGGAFAVRRSASVFVDSSQFVSNRASLTTGYGGAVSLDQSASLTVSGGLFVNNTASDGGAIAIGGIAQVELNDEVSFVFCSANSGGAITTYGASQVRMSNALVYGCHASNGGGLYVAGGTCTITASRLTANRAIISAGAAFVDAAANVTIRESQLDRNYASIRGGAISCESCRLFVGGSMIHDNKVAGNDGTSSGGGAIHASHSAFVVVSNSSLTRHSAERGYGGAVAVLSMATVALSSSTITGGLATQGGCMYVSSATLNAINVTIELGNAQRGGAMLFADATAVLRHSHVAQGVASQGGGICNLRSQVTLHECFVTECVSNLLGGGILSSGGALLIVASSVTRNVALTDGGALVVDAGTVLMLNSSFIGNRASEDGGVMHSTGTAAVSASGLFCGSNRAVGGGGTFVTFASYDFVLLLSTIVDSSAAVGGAIAVAAGRMTAQHVTVENANAVAYSGGAVSVFLLGSVVFSDSYLASCSALQGGAIVLVDLAKLAMSRTVVTGCIGRGEGGAISASEDSSLETHDVIFVGCRALHGGAISVGDQTAVSIVGGAFRGNVALSRGGALSVGRLARVDVRGTRFYNNTAVDSGGFAHTTDQAVLRVINGTVEHHAALNGGAFAVHRQAALLVYRTTVSNVAALRGGAVWCGTDAVVQFVNGSHVSRAVADEGGAVVADGSCDVTFDDSVVDRCTARLGGFAQLFEDSELTVSGSTIQQCAASSGGAIRAAGASFVAIRDSVVAACEAATDGGGLHISGQHSLVIERSVFVNCSAGTGGGLAAAESADASISDVSISNCTATADTGQGGGGISLQDSSHATVARTNISNCHAPNSNGGGVACNIQSGDAATAFSNVTIRRCSAARGGGGLFAEGTAHTMILRHVSIMDNVASAGGGIFTAGTLELTVEGLTVRHNRAGCSGGGLLCDGGAHITLRTETDADISFNYAGSLGEDVFCRDVTCAVSLVDDIGGHSNGTAFGHALLSQCAESARYPVYAQPAAVDLRGAAGRIVLTRGTYNSSLAIRGAGSVDIQLVSIREHEQQAGGSISDFVWHSPSGPHLTVTGQHSVEVRGISLETMYAANTEGSPGAIHCDGPGTVVALKTVSLVHQGFVQPVSATGSCHLRVVESEIRGPVGLQSANSADGGCFRITSAAQVHVSQSSIIGCNAAVSGGALFATDEGTTVIIEDTTMSDCRAGRVGGTLAIQSGAHLAMMNVTITSSSAASGGCVSLLQATLVADALALERCSAHSDGGALALLGADAVLANSRVVDCSADGAGGGVSAKLVVPTAERPLAAPVGASLTILDSRLTDNTAEHSGGAVDASAPSNTPLVETDVGISVALRHVVVARNAAAGNGGGVAIAPGVSAVVEASSFSENHAGDCGGALFVAGGFCAVGNGTSVAVNVATRDGGGIAALRPGDSVSLSVDQSSHVSGNRATTGRGGGIYVIPTHVEQSTMLGKVYDNCGVYGPNVFVDQGSVASVAGDLREVSGSAVDIAPVLLTGTDNTGRQGVRAADGSIFVSAFLAVSNGLPSRATFVEASSATTSVIAVALVDGHGGPAPPPPGGAFAEVRIEDGPEGSQLVGVTRVPFIASLTAGCVESIGCGAACEPSEAANFVSTVHVARFDSISVVAPPTSSLTLVVGLSGDFGPEAAAAGLLITAHISRCPDGTEVSDVLSCVPCAPGTSRGPEDGDQACDPCPAGTAAARPGALECDQCEPGEASGTGPAAGLACTPAPVGHVVSADGTSFVACTPGTAAAVQGLTECTPCEGGRISSLGAETCRKCPHGFTSNADHSACTACPAGTAANEEGSVACSTCPVGSKSSRGAAECEVCPDGTYAVDRRSCVRCPLEGVVCTNGILAVKEGYYLSDPGANFTIATGSLSISSQATLHQCPPGACIEGAHGMTECAPGRTGPLCGSCLEDHFAQGTECVGCPDEAVSIILVVVLIFALAGGMAVTVRRATTAYQRASVADSMLMPTCKTLFNYAQTAGFFNGFDVSWPAAVGQYWAVSGSASTVPVSASFVSCALNFGFYARFWLATLAPVIAAVLLLVIPLWPLVRSGHPNWSLYRTAVQIATFVLYPTVSKQVVQALDCTEAVDGVRYLAADFRVVCGDTAHVAHVVVAIGTLIGFCIGGPLLLAWKINQIANSGHLQARWARKKYLIYYEGYRRETAWWEAVSMWRKLAVLIVASTLSGASHSHQVYAGVIVLAIALAVQLRYVPYANAFQDKIEIASLAVLCGSLYLGLLIALGGLSDSARVIVALVVIGINVSFVGVCVVVVARELRGMTKFRRRLPVPSPTTATPTVQTARTSIRENPWRSVGTPAPRLLPSRSGKSGARKSVVLPSRARRSTIRRARKSSTQRNSVQRAASGVQLQALNPISSARDVTAMQV